MSSLTNASCCVAIGLAFISGVQRPTAAQAIRATVLSIGDGDTPGLIRSQPEFSA